MVLKLCFLEGSVFASFNFEAKAKFIMALEVFLEIFYDPQERPSMSSHSAVS